MNKRRAGEAGFTLVELTVSLFILMVIVISFFGLFIALVHSTVVAKRKAVANTLAVNQMEYLKSLPYDSLAVQGGSIVGTSTIPATENKTVNGTAYKVTTAISYVDDAYDGCGPYPSLEIKKKYCRNYPSPSGAPATDTNPADYKDLNVIVTDKNGTRFASVDTQVSARVAETASTTGAMFVTVYDPSGTGIAGATVNVRDTVLSPAVNVTDTTDGNGMAIFYGLPPDSAANYVIKADKTGYSLLQTIASSGSLTPSYPNQRVLTQQASEVSLTLVPMTVNSVALETTTTAGAALPNVKVYVKGGYKKYTNDTDTTYYYDSMAPTDTRPVTDAAGLAGMTNLAPIGQYVFCGDAGNSGCVVGGTTYYLAAAVPYGGTKSLGPITIPPYDSTNQPSFDYGGTLYQQKVRLILTPSSTFPRVFTITPDHINLSTNLTNVKFSLTGRNLNGATMQLKQNSINIVPKNCTAAAASLTCGFDLSSVAEGDLEVSVTNGSGTLTLPVVPLGGVHVKP